MDDEFEDKLFYQTFSSHMKILSKFAVGISSINSPAAYIWKICRLYILRPEVIICGVILFLLLIYLQVVDVWTRSILGRIQATLGQSSSARTKISESTSSGSGDHWEDVRQQSSAYAVLGRRPRMEDRFVIEENINDNTGISFFAIFDGHGGEFAADFAKDVLVKNIYNKVVETTKLLKSQSKENSGADSNQYAQYDASPYLRRKTEGQGESKNKENEPGDSLKRQRDSFRKTHSTNDDVLKSVKKEEPIDFFTSKLNSLMRSSGVAGGKNAAKDSLLNNNNIQSSELQKGGDAATRQDAKLYIENGKINFGKLITDEILAADHKLVEAAKKSMNIAGTTALIAIIHGSKLLVANVGDSRGVMCNSRGMAIPLSFDHKPQQVRERKRIHDAGGFIAFRGVWRVAGILATSRALGDYPLKENNLVIANPDILAFELNDHKPNFLILASDGLWDTFSNEEACSFISEHIKETDFGAKSLAMQSYQRGSVDNITVLVIVFKNGNYYISSSSNSQAALVDDTNTKSKQVPAAKKNALSK